MTKWLVSNHHSYNINNIDDIYVSNNYLMLTTGGGQAAREVQVIYGTEKECNAIHDAIMAWIDLGQSKVFDCDGFMAKIR